mmetsp:Transcript_681/g.735  ORF Transcript_681/g.735 Transcript_681/m.735 type:complete len:110 (+) Transcript_681:1641-1970(+)
MFEMLVDMDLTGDVTVKKLLEIPYEVDGEDEDLNLTMQGFLKVIKMLMYKLGLTYKRQDYFKVDLLEQMEKKHQEHKAQTQHSIKEINEFIHGFNLEFDKFLQRQKKDR